MIDGGRGVRSSSESEAEDEERRGWGGGFVGGMVELEELEGGDGSAVLREGRWMAGAGVGVGAGDNPRVLLERRS